MASLVIQGLAPFGFVVGESQGNDSRDVIMIAQNQTIVVGQVLGKIGTPASETATVAANSGNSGNGVLTVSAIGASAIDGSYTINLASLGGTGAVFEVIDPNGIVVGVGRVGTAFVGPISFVLSAGSSSWAVGDLISVTVARPLSADLYETWNPTAADGSQTAVAIAGSAIVTGASPSKITGITRDASVRKADLTFSATATQAQLNDAEIALRKCGSTCR